MECSISIDDQKGNAEEIKRNEPDTAEETLGVFVAVDGNQRAEKKKLSDASNSWTRKIVSSGLFRNEVVMAIITTISRTWQYPLQSTTFTCVHCEDIMRPLHSEVLPKIGANR